MPRADISPRILIINMIFDAASSHVRKSLDPTVLYAAMPISDQVSWVNAIHHTIVDDAVSNMIEIAHEKS